MSESTTTNADALLPYYRRAGVSTATVYLPAPSGLDDAEHQFEIRQKNVSTQLKQSGASSDLIRVVKDRIHELAHDGANGYVIVATVNDGASVVDVDRRIDRVAVHVELVPALLPLIGAQRADIEHLAVLIDRTGADVLLRSGVGPAEDGEIIAGSDERVHRSHAGGWSQRRFQQIAENAWERNASEVADQIASDHPEVDLIICAGDERAVGFFTAALPARFEVHTLEGSRHSEPSGFLDAADVVLRSRQASALVDHLDHWRSMESSGRAATGRSVLDLLAQGRVEHLLVVDDTEETQRRRAGFDFEAIAHVEGGGDVPITDAAVALAVATGADVSVVPSSPDLEDGLAAILRF